MHSEYFYRGFDSASSIGKPPNSYNTCIKMYKEYRNLAKIDGSPELGDWIDGWNMFYILKFNHDGLNNDIRDKYYDVAIVFDLSKLDSNQVFRLWYWIQNDHGVNTEFWHEYNYNISKYESGGEGYWDGKNYHLISSWDMWRGELLRFLITEGYPDDSYRVIPDPNI